jgi:hypothetical protein
MIAVYWGKGGAPGWGALNVLQQWKVPGSITQGSGAVDSCQCSCLFLPTLFCLLLIWFGLGFLEENHFFLFFSFLFFFSGTGA